MASFVSEEQENAKKNIQAAPMCTRCCKIVSAISKCLTCTSYLCERCDFSHRVKVCFDGHNIVLLENDITEELSTIDNDNNNKTIYDPDVTIRSDIKEQIIRGSKYLNEMLQGWKDLEESMKNLGMERSSALEQINQCYMEFSNHLKKLRDEVVNSLDTYYNARHSVVQVQKENLEHSIVDFTFKLSNMQLIADDNDGETASGIDITTFYNYFNRFLASSVTEQLENLPPKTNENVSSHSSKSTNDPSTSESEGSCLNPDVDPFEPIKLPPEPSREAAPVVNSAFPLTIPSPANSNVANSNLLPLYQIFGNNGSSSGQFSSPNGFCLGFDEDIVIADSSNHRIQIFDKSGCFKFQFGHSGRRDGQLWHPRKVAMLPLQRCYIICDRGYERSRLQIFSEDGDFYKKISIHYVNIVSGIAVTQKEDIVIVDSVVPTVFIIGQNGFLRTIDVKPFSEEPSDIAVSGKEFYICDFKGHQIIVIDEDGNLLRKFGSKCTTNFPNGIDVSVTGHVLVGDSHGNYFHICIFTKEGDFISEFRCHTIKVSRCCGLKITSCGRLVTIDKNFNFVLMLNPPYFT